MLHNNVFSVQYIISMYDRLYESRSDVYRNIQQEI